RKTQENPRSQLVSSTWLSRAGGEGRPHTGRLRVGFDVGAAGRERWALFADFGSPLRRFRVAGCPPASRVLDARDTQTCDEFPPDSSEQPSVTHGTGGVDLSWPLLDVAR